MQFNIKCVAAETHPVGCAIVFIYEAQPLSAAAKAINTASGGAIDAALADGDLTAKPGSVLLLRGVPHVAAKRVLLVGLGAAQPPAEKDYLDALQAAFKALLLLGSPDAALFLDAHTDAARCAWAVSTIVTTLGNVRYRFDAHKSKPAQPEEALTTLSICVDTAMHPMVQQGITLGNALNVGTRLTRDLGNAPPNVCTPTYLANTAQKLADQYQLEIEVLEKDTMAELGMGALLCVAKGSTEPPKFIILKYLRAAPSANRKPIVLVGKGITFDSGGISLKPGENMDEMKYDMCGAAAVFGVIQAIAELNLPIDVIAVVPSCENMPAGNANKPGDIVHSMSGQTIEILNTDAEGRLILCDALTYVERFNPAAVIDMATLTGACVIALGFVNTGLYANDESLAAELLHAAAHTRDWAWRLPLQVEYEESLKSNFADVANIGGRPGGSITAATFLARFTKKYPWAHLDIAGTAWKSGAAKGATGRPVPLMVEFLRRRADVAT